MCAVQSPGQILAGQTAEYPAPLVMLTPQQVCRIDAALARLGAFGEVRLVVDHGRLRFIQTLTSEDINKAQAPDVVQERNPSPFR
jgi:hypothetical protein